MGFRGVTGYARSALPQSKGAGQKLRLISAELGQERMQKDVVETRTITR